MKIFRITVMTVGLITLVTALAACGRDNKPEQEPPPVIIEPGLAVEELPTTGQENDPVSPPEDNTQAEPVEEFTDLGRASTLDDLMANKAKIESYYYEQTLNYAAGTISLKTWYKGGMMKIISSVAGMPETINFYDCYAYEFITYTPAISNNAVLTVYEKGNPEIPANPLDYNYHDYRVLETDSIDRQVCRVLEGPDGEKLWISTQYGFPIQVEFTDTLSDEHLIVSYENLVVNQVSDEDVAIPPDLGIYEMQGGEGFYNL